MFVVVLEFELGFGSVELEFDFDEVDVFGIGNERSHEESGVRWMRMGRGGEEEEDDVNAARMEAQLSWGWEESCGVVVVEVMLVDGGGNEVSY